MTVVPLEIGKLYKLKVRITLIEIINNNAIEARYKEDRLKNSFPLHNNDILIFLGVEIVDRLIYNQTPLRMPIFIFKEKLVTLYWLSELDKLNLYMEVV